MVTIFMENLPQDVRISPNLLTQTTIEGALEFIHHIIDFIVHIDHHLNNLVVQYGGWTYAILFLIVFCETGLVVTPFLPGDSLLFVIGALTAGADAPLDLGFSLLILTVAAILGDTVNYSIGKYLAPKIFRNENVKFLNMEHLKKTQEFFNKYGGKTIILARFVPIVRTFAPFVAGMGNMAYGRFIFYNVIGALIWVFTQTLAGYFFGKIPIVEKNFSKVVLIIIFVSILPAVFEVWNSRKDKKH